jgi:acetyltransferase-like isoleucine patch superfamily enzyme
MFFDDERSNRLRRLILTEAVGMFLNDSERAKLYGLPEGTRIRAGVKIVSPEHLRLGDHCWIGENVILDAGGGLEIGEHTGIGVSAMIFTHTSWLNNMTLQNASGTDLIERKPVTIGKGCFIGANSVIMPGVTIGDFATVQPLALVIQDVPARCMVSGNPARVFTRYDDAFIAAEIERVRTENARRREIATARGDTVIGGSPFGWFDEDDTSA